MQKWVFHKILNGGNVFQTDISSPNGNFVELAQGLSDRSGGPPLPLITIGQVPISHPLILTLLGQIET